MGEFDKVLWTSVVVIHNWDKQDEKIYVHMNIQRSLTIANEGVPGANIKMFQQVFGLFPHFIGDTF